MRKILNKANHLPPTHTKKKLATSCVSKLILKYATCSGMHPCIKCYSNMHTYVVTQLYGV
jgi:hypothetical protein